MFGGAGEIVTGAVVVLLCCCAVYLLGYVFYSLGGLWGDNGNSVMITHVCEQEGQYNPESERFPEQFAACVQQVDCSWSHGIWRLIRSLVDSICGCLERCRSDC